MPFISMLTPAGICGLPGIPRNHCTDIGAVMGAILKFPVAINCTIPEGDFAASAADGVTVTLCTKRCWVIGDMDPPQETADTTAMDRARKRRAVDLRIDNLQSAMKAKYLGRVALVPPSTMILRWPREWAV